MEPTNNFDPGAGGSSVGMPQAAELVLAYLFGWIGGLIFYLIERKNKFVRFHAAQSLLASATVTVLSGAGRFMWFSPLHYFSGLLGLAYFVLMIWMIVQSVQGRFFKLPIIGDIAEKMANQP